MNQAAKFVVGIFILGVVVVVGYLVVKGLGNPAPTGPIKIGLSSPMTGEAASYGEAFYGGASLAVKEINDAGGIRGRNVELIVEDDQCSAEGANAISKLVNVDHVTAIVGPLCSAAAGPGLPIAQKAGVPTLVIASAPNLTKIGDYIFRNYPSDALQAKFAADFIFNQLKKKKVAVIYVKNDYGQGLRDSFVENFKRLGGEVVYDDSILQDSTDLRTQLSKAKAAKPEVLYFPVYPQNAVAGLKQVKEMGMKVVVVSGDSLSDDSVIKLPEAEGLYYITGKTNNPPEFQQKVKEVSGKHANVFTPYTYDAVKILAWTIGNTGTDQKAMKNELVKLSYRDSVAVPLVEFDANRDLKSAEFTVQIVKGGKGMEYSQ